MIYTIKINLLICLMESYTYISVSISVIKGVGSVLRITTKGLTPQFVASSSYLINHAYE